MQVVVLSADSVKEIVVKVERIKKIEFLIAQQAHSDCRQQLIQPPIIRVLATGKWQSELRRKCKVIQKRMLVLLPAAITVHNSYSKLHRAVTADDLCEEQMLPLVT